MGVYGIVTLNITKGVGMKLVRKLTSTIGASLTILIGMSFGAAPLASAAPSCTSGRVCIWDTAGYGGSTLAMTSPGAGFCKTIPYADYKNMMSSAYNNISGKAISWYDGDNCTGAFLFSQAPGHVPAPSGTSNKANSFRVSL